MPLSRSQWTLWEHGLYETCNIAYRRAVLGLERGPAFRDDMPAELLRLFGPRFRFALRRGRRAGVGTAAAVRRPGAALLALPWVIARTRPWESGRRARLSTLPAEAVIEAATTVALVLGSAGAKSVVL